MTDFDATLQITKGVDKQEETSRTTKPLRSPNTKVRIYYHFCTYYLRPPKQIILLKINVNIEFRLAF